jgi:hypothetical protein
VAPRRGRGGAGTRFTCFTSTKVQILTLRGGGSSQRWRFRLASYPMAIAFIRQRTRERERARAVAAERACCARCARSGGCSTLVSRFTCFTSTKVQMLTQILRMCVAWGAERAGGGGGGGGGGDAAAAARLDFTGGVRCGSSAGDAAGEAPVSELSREEALLLDRDEALLLDMWRHTHDPAARVWGVHAAGSGSVDSLPQPPKRAHTEGTCRGYMRARAPFADAARVAALEEASGVRGVRGVVAALARRGGVAVPLEHLLPVLLSLRRASCLLAQAGCAQLCHTLCAPITRTDAVRLVSA